jgi:type II secretion system protein C
MRRALISLVLCFVSLAAVAADLRLVATMRVEPDPLAASRAVFESEGQQIWAGIGDPVGVCRLADVTDKQVLLDCGAEFVTILLSSGIATNRSAENKTQPKRHEITLSRSAFLSTLDDRQGIASQLSLEPYVADGYFYGYRVAWLKPGGDFQRLGLQIEDVIISVNDARASQPASFMQAVNSLGGQSSFDLGVDRDGERVSYAYLLE